MKLGLVTGTIEASAKDSSLSGLKLLIADLIDGTGDVIEPSCIAVDSCGAGVGDKVLITFGSAARMPASSAGTAVDATIIAVVDRVTLAAASAGSSKRKTPSKRKS